jgi:hypothetical protein
VLLDGGFGINIITKKLRLRSGLRRPKPTPYDLRMVDQTTTKSVGLIKDIKIYVHGIPYIITFTILQNSVVDSSYSMLLGRPWLRDAKVAHDWGSNTITLQGNGTIRTIIVTKHLGSEVRRPEVLLCYDYQNGITDEKEDIIFTIEPKLFSIGTISLPKTIQFVKTTYVGIMDTDVKTNILEQRYVQSTQKKILSNKYEPKVIIQDKVYPKTYYRHQLGSVVVDEILAKNQSIRISNN